MFSFLYFYIHKLRHKASEEFTSALPPCPRPPKETNGIKKNLWKEEQEATKKLQ